MTARLKIEQTEDAACAPENREETELCRNTRDVSHIWDEGATEQKNIQRLDAHPCVHVYARVGFPLYDKQNHGSILLKYIFHSQLKNAFHYTVD